MPSRTAGISGRWAPRAWATTAAWSLAASSLTRVVASVARYQNGETSERRALAVSMVVRPVSVLQYGTQPVTARRGGPHALRSATTASATATRALARRTSEPLDHRAGAQSSSAAHG